MSEVDEIKEKRKQELIEKASGPSVIVYSTPTCPWCFKAKEYFLERGVPFEDVDVSQDHDRAMEMIQKSGQQGVPVIDINGTIIVGFDRTRIHEALNA